VARTTRTLLDGLAFPEGPRWRDGRLVFSDQHDHRVVSLDPATGDATTVCEVEQQPSGLGWLPDGRMLVVSMVDQKVLRLEDDQLVEHADLSGIARHHCNDMVVDRTGRCYVGSFGFDIHYAEQVVPVETTLAIVEPDGRPRSGPDGMRFPNGTVITPDGATLIVGESYGGALTAFDIAPDGSLSGRREWARVVGHVPDGICLDAEGAIWMACPICEFVLRVREGGEIVDTVQVDHHPFACMLGGVDRRTLFVCTAEDSHPDAAIAAHTGAIESVEVDVPGAGLP
jgi:sugar lactone lactonase YvrE